MFINEWDKNMSTAVHCSKLDGKVKYLKFSVPKEKSSQTQRDSLLTWQRITYRESKTGNYNFPFICTQCGSISSGYLLSTPINSYILQLETISILCTTGFPGPSIFWSVNVYWPISYQAGSEAVKLNVKLKKKKALKTKFCCRLILFLSNTI